MSFAMSIEPMKVIYTTAITDSRMFPHFATIPLARI